VPAGVSDPWLLVTTIGVATIVLRGVVPAVLGGRPLGGRLLGAIELLPPALLAALVATQVFATKSALVLDERALGLAAAAAALLLRAPLLVVIAVAAATTALARTT
jgi:branched-subunit amino acid transport protein